MNKKILLVLTAIMMLVAFTGCKDKLAQNTDSPEVEVTQPVESKAPVPDAVEPVVEPFTQPE